MKKKKENGCKMCSDKKCEGIRDECAQKKKNEFEDRQVKELTSMLNNGIIGHYFLLPSLGEIIPNLLADLKNYHLIPANQMENFSGYQCLWYNT